MRTLCVQFQPQRSPQLSSTRVLGVFARSVALDPAVLRFEVHKGNDRGPYFNFHFFCQNRSLPHVWSLVERRALKHRALGGMLRRASIVTCEGSRGWANYRLLHHFDPEVPLEVL